MARTMRKVRVGAVVRTNQDKTAIVEMVWKQRHRLYRKQVRRVARFYVHDPENQCRLGDTVRIEETRPISKNKHWRLMEILNRRQVAEVRPIDVETDVGIEITQPRIVAAEARAEAAEAAADEEPAVVEETAEEEPEVEEELVAEEPAAEEEPVEEQPVEEELVEEEPEAEAEPVEDEPEAEQEPEGDGDTDGDDPGEQEEKE